MVFQSNFILGLPTVKKSHAYTNLFPSTLVLLCIYSRLYSRRPREAQKSAAASASRLEHLGLLILPILRSGAFVYIHA
jgi:hypothetical protein